MPVYSFSQIRVFEQCPLKYRYQYLDKIKTEKEPQSPHLLLGNAVHRALERLYKQLNQFQSPSEQALVDVFMTYREREIDRDEMIFPQDVSEDIFTTRWVAYLRAYRQKYAPFGDVKVVMTEWRIVFSLDDTKQLKFRGVIDRLDKEWSTFIINDYKTNKHLPQADQDMYKEQLTLYALGVQQKYGAYYDQLKARLHYLHFDLVDEWEIDAALMTSVTDKYTATVREIEDRRFHHNMGDHTRFPATENSSCKRCPYMSICPLWAHASMDDEIILWEKTVVWLVDEYAELSKQARALDKQKKTLKETLGTYLRQKKLKKLFGKEFQLSATPGVSYSVKDPVALEQYFLEQWVLDQYKQLDRYAITRALKDEDLDLEAIKDMIEIKEHSTLRVSKKKEEKK